MSYTVNPTAADAWLHPFASTDAPSLSERFIRGLEAHVADEAHDIAACEELARRAGDPIVCFLFSLIVEDEQHHHAVIRSMISRLHEEIDFTAAPGDSLIPRAESCQPVADATELAAGVRALIRDEQEGARHIRHLARQDPSGHDGLYPLLLETIARDSEKHATILRFILRYVERSTGR